MKFGNAYTGEKQASAGGGKGKWIKTLKEGETRIRFLQEFKGENPWVEYWEHYNPVGTSFPCTGDRDTCPGCTSTNERMKKAGLKIAVNAVVGNYQDVYKLPRTLVNRLQIKADRNGGTITDRDYIITRIGKDVSTEYDVESGNALPIDLNAYELMDIEAMLAEQFRENWPDFEADQVLNAAEPKKSAPVNIHESMGKKPETTEEKPAPFEATAGGPTTPQPTEQEVEISIQQLHTMTPEQLRTLCATNGAEVPDELSTPSEIISWMEKQFA